MSRPLWITACAFLLVAGCRDGDVPRGGTSAPGVSERANPPAGPREPRAVAVAGERDARATVEELGRRMKNVPLLADAAVVRRAMQQAYGGLVSPPLLRRWLENPPAAPGRLTSSPWPERIEVTSIARRSGRAEVSGVLVESTSTGESGRAPVALTLEQSNGRWLVTQFSRLASPGGSGGEEQSASAAVAVVREYYEAIDRGDFGRAWDLWRDGGPPGRSREEFVRGFRDTASARVETGDPSRIEGAAGSRYVEVPVEVSARTRSGTEQRFKGTFTLRRSVVDGATPEQRRWRIERASLAPVR